MEGRSILTASFPEFIHELSFSSARGTGVSLEIDVSEDKTQSGWQCQEGKCNRKNKSFGRCFVCSRLY